ncbi:FMN-binding negative transcriptional regulator [Viridibacterium curvum]|uniref:FMN-binding negative transcriptional regulator n=1 Tax=Viridibacterium curvum TaxID=1101404 RepID=A0ABP9QV46_9RHOO
MLYSPARFIETDTALIRELIAAHPFATLMSVVEGQPLVSHVPLVADERGWLLGHVAMANPHSAALNEGAEALAIFQGPHCYVSPSWYAEASVPTWNYTAVHVRARLHVLQGDAAQALLDRLTQAFDDPAQPGHMTAAQRARLLPAIHCFALEPLETSAKFKLSQNKSREDQQSILANLGQFEDDNSQGVASLMLRNLAAGFGD